jgi:hypothetical protein
MFVDIRIWDLWDYGKEMECMERKEKEKEKRKIKIEMWIVTIRAKNWDLG